MVRFSRSIERATHWVLFPPNDRAALWPQLALAVLVAAFVYKAGPDRPLMLALGILPGLFILFGPSRILVTLFLVFMVATHQFRSFFLLRYAGIVWHPRELLLFGLAVHWVGKAVQQKVRFRYDPAHWGFVFMGLFVVQIALVGLFREPDLHRVVAECRYPIFLLAYPVFVSLVQGRSELRYHIRVVFRLTVLIALASLAFFTYTFVTGNVVNTQNALGEFVQRQVGPRLVQSVRPNGHMFFEVSVVVLASLLFCPGVAKTRRVVYLGLIGLFCAAIAVTMMRTAYAALLVSLAILAFLSLPDRRLQVLTATLAVAITLVALLFLGGVLLDATKEAMPGLGASIEGRLVEITGAWRAFLGRPVLGAGMGSRFEAMGYVAKTSELAYARTTYATVHNVWAYYLFKGGLLGLVLVGLGLGTLFLRGYCLIPAVRDAADRYMLRGLVAALGGQFVASIAMPRLTYPSGYVFLAMMGCCFAVFAVEADRAEDSEVGRETTVVVEGTPVGQR